MGTLATCAAHCARRVACNVGHATRVAEEEEAKRVLGGPDLREADHDTMF